MLKLIDDLCQYIGCKPEIFIMEIEWQGRLRQPFCPLNSYK